MGISLEASRELDRGYSEGAGEGDGTGPNNSTPSLYGVEGVAHIGQAAYFAKYRKSAEIPQELVVGATAAELGMRDG